MVGERHNVAFLVGVIFGAAGAAVAALLYTPLSGAETRQQLSERVAALRGGDSTPGSGSVQNGGTPGTTTRIYSGDATELADAQHGDATTKTTRIYSSGTAEPTRTADGDTTVGTTRTFGS